MKKLLYLFSLPLPWRVRRWILSRFFGFKLDPTCRIGLSWVMPDQLVMGPKSRIGHLTLCKGLQRMELAENASIGNGNWITGFPLSLTKSTGHFAHQEDRSPTLLVKRHAAITHRHTIDCTHAVTVGEFSTLAGYGSQILTHSIDLEACRQDSHPVTIGAYCFVGTNVAILGGSVLPDNSVLGAKSLLNKAWEETHRLYGGVPAKPVRELSPEMGYFVRETGFVR